LLSVSISKINLNPKEIARHHNEIQTVLCRLLCTANPYKRQ
jgi:hypothetical protein